MAPRDIRGIISAISVDHYEMILYAKYQSSRPFCFRDEDILRFYYIFLCKTGPYPGVAPHDPKGIILAISVDHQEMIIHAKCKSSGPFG